MVTNKKNYLVIPDGSESVDDIEGVFDTREKARQCADGKDQVMSAWMFWLLLLGVFLVFELIRYLASIDLL